MTLLTPQILLGEALRYERTGWKVFPVHSIRDGRCSCGKADCSSPGKHPRTRRGVHDAEWCSADRIRAWWDGWPDANIGLATGEMSGVYVLDLDGEEGIEEWWRIAARAGGSPNTMAARTGSGGLHLYFTADRPLPNTAKRIGQTIDSRGDGGYVLLPPSVNANGAYRWTAPHPAAPIPTWLLRMIRGPKRKRHESLTAVRTTFDDTVAMRILEEEASDVERTGEGARNDRLFTCTKSIAELSFGGELSIETVAARMLEAALHTGLPEREAQATILSAIDYAKTRPRRIRSRGVT